MNTLQNLLAEPVSRQALTHDQSIYLYPHIPRNKLANALSSYIIDAHVITDDIVLLLDDTLFGSAKDGLSLTDTTLYVHEKFSEPVAYDLSAISSVYWRNELLAKVLYIDGERVMALSQPHETTLTALCQVISTYLQHATAHTSQNQQQAATKQSAANPNQSTPATPPHTVNSTTDSEDLPTFELGMITADILKYFCLRYSNHWTDEKLTFIYQATIPIHSKPYLFSLLKHRLASIERPSLEESVDYLMQHEPPEEVRLLLMQQAFQIMAQDESDLIKVEGQIKQFALLLHIRPAPLNQLCQQFRQQYHYGNVASFTHEQHELLHACQILDIDPEQMTASTIQQAYRNKIQEFHPDKYQSLPAAVRQLLEAKAQELNQARDILLAYVQYDS